MAQGKLYEYIIYFNFASVKLSLWLRLLYKGLIKPHPCSSISLLKDDGDNLHHFKFNFEIIIVEYSLQCYRRKKPLQFSILYKTAPVDVRIM